MRETMINTLAVGDETEFGTVTDIDTVDENTWYVEFARSESAHTMRCFPLDTIYVAD